MFNKKSYNKKYYKKYPWVRILGGINFRCNSAYGKYKGRGIKNYLTKEDIKFLWFRDKAYLMKHPSIDRIDGWENYTIENCRFIELRINQATKRTNKINFDIAQKIRKEFLKGRTLTSIGKQFGVTRQFAGQINNNKWYKPELYLN